MQSKNDSLKTEEAKVKLASGQEMSLVYCSNPGTESQRTCLVIAHGAGGPMYSPFIRYFHTELAKRGFLTVKFNFPYMEARRKIPDRRQVLEESYRTIIEKVRSSKYEPSSLFIGGKSMGGRIASQIAADGVDIDGLFFLGYPLHPPGKTDSLRDEHLYRIKEPMLFLSGTRDSFARKDLLETVVSRIGPNAQVHWIQDGDHSFKTPEEKAGASRAYQEALGVLVDWVEAHNHRPGS